MQSLIADRFLKRFFGSHWNPRRITPASGEITSPANETEKPDEPAHPSTGNPPVTEPALGNEQTTEVNQLARPQDASDQPTTDDYPLTSDEPENA